MIGVLQTGQIGKLSPVVARNYPPPSAILAKSVPAPFSEVTYTSTGHTNSEHLGHCEARRHTFDRMQKHGLLILLKILRGAALIPNVTSICAFSEEEAEKELEKDGGRSHDSLGKFFPVPVALSPPNSRMLGLRFQAGQKYLTKGELALELRTVRRECLLRGKRRRHVSEGLHSHELFHSDLDHPA